jgi:cardiolipin synthase A/B
MYSMLLLAISSARTTIHITKPYFLPDARLRDALVKAARRGVHVWCCCRARSTTPWYARRADASSAASWRRASRSMSTGRDCSTRRRWWWTGCGRRWGATNFDNRSFALNEELNVAIYSRDVAQRLERVFAEDLEHSHRIRRAEWQSRGIRTRVLEWLTLPLWPQL